VTLLYNLPPFRPSPDSAAPLSAADAAVRGRSRSEEAKAEAALLVNNVLALGGDEQRLRAAEHAARMGAVKALLAQGVPPQRNRAAGILLHVSGAGDPAAARALRACGAGAALEQCLLAPQAGGKGAAADELAAMRVRALMATVNMNAAADGARAARLFPAALSDSEATGSLAELLRHALAGAPLLGVAWRPADVLMPSPPNPPSH